MGATAYALSVVGRGDVTAGVVAAAAARPDARTKKCLFIGAYRSCSAAPPLLGGGWVPRCSHVGAQATSQDDIETFTLVQLKAELRARGLQVSGRKAELIARLRDAGVDADTEDAEADAEHRVVPRGGCIQAGDVIYLKSWTGKYLDFSEIHPDVKARGTERGHKEAIVVEKPGGGEITAGDSIYLRSKKRGVNIDVLGSAVRVRYDDHGDWQRLSITKQGGSGPICSGDTVYLRGHQGMTIDVEDIHVRARWPDEGDWQRLIVETER